MLTILWILLSFALPVLGIHLPVSCPQDKECQLALLSNNDVLLECNVSKARWFFFGLNLDGKPVSVSGISSDPESNLLIQNPSPFSTGLYECQDENGIRVTGYKIDFQDVTRLHVTHLGLNREPLTNDTLNLGHGEILYTRWEPWQKCNNCQNPGEHTRLGESKRLGYCYVKEPLEEPVPCGIYLGDTKTLYDRVRPEMQAGSLGSQRHCSDLAGPAFWQGHRQLNEPGQRWPAAADLPASHLQMFRGTGTDSPVQPRSLCGAAGGRETNQRPGALAAQDPARQSRLRPQGPEVDAPDGLCSRCGGASL
uniref:protein FAM187B isoform X3 n=1 Tax=Myodes glareolus TaxID=447135 RepID=UPI0020216F4E|nr:protein FAM187B isoform X3 [Myodes glareolus]